MKVPRRIFLHLAAAAAALPCASRFAWALDYPTRPARIVVPVPAGLAPDIIGRLIGQWLSEHLGQPFIVENRPGSGNNIGTELVVRAPPDGYTLLMVTSPNAVNATLYDNLKFNFIRDITPVSGIVGAPLVMEVNPSVPAKTVAELVAYAKANPGKLSMASVGNGSPPHVAGELFKMITGIDMLHVPYSGNPLPDLLAGQVQVYFGVIPSSIGYIRAGKLRALAVTSTTRSQALPDVPTMKEFVPGYAASGWYGIGAPRSTPTEIVNKLSNQINAALTDPQIKARLADLGAEPMPMSPVEFGKFIADETEKWGKVIKFAGIKPE
jgi:tripartite-type tricarboxylate transporter receptor subunit TctC